PGPDPALPSERRWHPPRGVKVPSPLGKNLRKVASLALACAGLAACNALPQDGGVALAMLGYAAAVVTWPWVPAQEKAAARTASAKARAEWEVLLSRWNREARRQIFAAELDR